SRRDVGRDVGLREVLQPGDDADHEREEGQRADRRQRHPTQALEWPSSIQLGRLVQMPRNVEDGREKDDHDVADAPEPEQDKGWLRPTGRLEPERAVDAEMLEQNV